MSRNRPLALPLVAVLLAVGVLACAGRSDRVAEDTADLLVATAQGLVEGALVDDGRGSPGDVLVFRGLAYAAPPMGDLRWRPPAPPAPWEGVRQALAPGAPCWQRITPDTSIYSRGEMESSEDCLYLDLWTTAGAVGASEEPRPVMVWFHGGSHEMGHGSSRIFDGAALARRHVVLVAVNYRLGALGFLAHPGLRAESEVGASGNYGLLDKIAALEWVETNAAAFGGDPERVLIFGQSAGSMSVCSLIASPLAAGLFHRAIGQSGGCFLPLPTLEQAERRGVTLAAELGVREDVAAASVAALRATSPEQILAAEASSGWGAGSKIVVDGWYLPDQPAAIYARGEHNRVPLVVGSMADESTALFPPGPPLDRGELERQLNEQYGEAAPALLSAYAAEIEQAAAAVPGLIRSDALFAWGSRAWARHVAAAADADAYLYFVDHAPPVFRLYLHDRPELDGEGGPRRFGAYHSGDLAYVFGNVDLVGVNWGERDREVASLLAGYWTNFAKTGDPNGEGLPEWPRYDREGDWTLVVGSTATTVESAVRKPKLDALDAAFGGS